MEGLVAIIYLGLATSAISVALTRAGIAKSLRSWIKAKAGSYTPFSCAFCMSLWVSLPLCLVYRPVIVPTYGFVDFLVSVAAVVGFASMVSGFAIQTIPGLKKEDE